MEEENVTTSRLEEREKKKYSNQIRRFQAAACGGQL